MPSLSLPILTVVIPTIGMRDTWLSRCVDSSLRGWGIDECEVLIILNSNIEKYEFIAEHFKNYPNVFIVVNKIKGVSAARNLGIKLAKGMTIRFLDDDDYLYPEIAVQQTKELVASDADLSSFGIDLRDENSQLIESRHPSDSDCISGLCSKHRVQIPISFVYKLTAIRNCSWNESLSLAEDTLWLLSILEQNIHLKWISKNISVGVWFQHSKNRLSKPYSTNQPALLIASKLIEIAKKLPNNEKRTPRISCITDAVWSCFLAGFKFSPLRWSSISKVIDTLSPNSRPNVKIYRLIPINPLVLSWILFPAFWAYHALKLTSNIRKSLEKK